MPRLIIVEEYSMIDVPFASMEFSMVVLIISIFSVCASTSDGINPDSSGTRKIVRIRLLCNNLCSMSLIAVSTPCQNNVKKDVVDRELLCPDNLAFLHDNNNNYHKCNYANRGKSEFYWEYLIIGWNIGNGIRLLFQFQRGVMY